jgi:hypothetical protein
MRSSWFILSLCIVVLFGMVPLLSAIYANASTGNTEVITDAKTQAVSVVIDGKKILVIDANGLRVNGNVEFTGHLRPTETSGH